MYKKRGSKKRERGERSGKVRVELNYFITNNIKTRKAIL